jgi:pSer/pThr/pTyr-binding forkhead associated (FHA) protein
MSAQHNGKVFPVGKAPLTIGRAAGACEIVYQEGTPGVSGKHCTVYYDSGTGLFTLTDLNSSYGTYLSNGLKLTPHTPVNLKPGDSFYVGDKSNVLKLEVE